MHYLVYTVNIFLPFAGGCLFSSDFILGLLNLLWIVFQNSEIACIFENIPKPVLFAAFHRSTILTRNCTEFIVLYYFNDTYLFNCHS